MRQKHRTTKSSAEKVVKDTRRRTRKRHSAEEKICIALDVRVGKPRSLRVEGRHARHSLDKDRNRFARDIDFLSFGA